MEPKITIITPTYKRDRNTIIRCLRSVDSQTYKNWEHIICSDGYDKKVKELVEQENCNKRIYDYVKHEGIYANNVRNKMIEKSSGDYILFLDDDNIIFPNYLEVSVNKLKHTSDKVGFCASKTIHFGPLPEDLGEPPVILGVDNINIGSIDTIQLLIKKFALKKIGGWDLKSNYYADGVTYSKLSKEYDYVKIDKVLSIHF